MHELKNPRADHSMLTLREVAAQLQMPLAFVRRCAKADEDGVADLPSQKLRGSIYVQQSWLYQALQDIQHAFQHEAENAIEVLRGLAEGDTIYALDKQNGATQLTAKQLYKQNLYILDCDLARDWFAEELTPLLSTLQPLLEQGRPDH